MKGENKKKAGAELAVVRSPQVERKKLKVLLPWGEEDFLLDLEEDLGDEERADYSHSPLGELEGHQNKVERKVVPT